MEAVDTLKLYERFRAANIDERAAKEIAEAINDVVKEGLVTKEYLDLRLAELKKDIVIDVIKWVASMLLAQSAVIAALIKIIK